MIVSVTGVNYDQFSAKKLATLYYLQHYYAGKIFDFAIFSPIILSENVYKFITLAPAFFLSVSAKDSQISGKLFRHGNRHSRNACLSTRKENISNKKAKRCTFRQDKDDPGQSDQMTYFKNHSKPNPHFVIFLFDI
jgi:hypothetical protein